MLAVTVQRLPQMSYTAQISHREGSVSYFKSALQIVRHAGCGKDEPVNGKKLKERRLDVTFDRLELQLFERLGGRAAG